MNTAALRLLIQDSQGRSRSAGDTAPPADDADEIPPHGGQALKRFAEAYLGRLPDALELLLPQAQAAALNGPLEAVLERALAGLAPAVLAQAPSWHLALLAAAYRTYRLLEEFTRRYAVWLGDVWPAEGPGVGRLVAHQVLGQLGVERQEAAVSDWLAELERTLEPRLTRQCFRSRLCPAAARVPRRRGRRSVR